MSLARLSKNAILLGFESYPGNSPLFGRTVMSESAWQKYCRDVRDERQKSMSPDELEDFLKRQVQEEIDGALIQEYLDTFGYRFIWRIVPVSDFEDLPGQG